MYVNVQLPNAASMQRADVVSDKIEGILLEYEAIDMVTTLTGYSLLSSSFTPNSCFFFITPDDWDKREETAEDVTRLINMRLASEIKEAQAFAFGPPAIPGLGQGSGFSIMIQDRSGGDPSYLQDSDSIIYCCSYGASRDWICLFHLPGQCSATFDGHQCGENSESRS